MQRMLWVGLMSLLLSGAAHAREGDSEPAMDEQGLGVHVGQGWLFNKALSAEAAEALILAAVAAD